MREGIRPAVALALLALVIVGAVAAIALNKRTMFYQRVGLEKSPEVLVERARELIRKLGYSYTPTDSAFDFTTNVNVLEYITNNDQSPNRWDKLDDFDAVTFWYRQSRFPIERAIFIYDAPGLIIAPDDPPLRYSEEAFVSLDGRGQLRNFTVIPPREVPPSSPAAPSVPDWTLLFSEAGLNIAAFKPVAPTATPSVYADTRAAWQGVMPNGDGPVRVEAAALEGKPVRFDIIAPWTNVSEFPTVFQGNAVWFGVFAVAVLFSMIGGGLFFARRNLRLGRGDRRGATRLVLFVLCIQIVAFTLLEHHVASFWEMQLVLMSIGGALFFMGITWTLYIGLESFVRRRWPHILVSWSRLLSGEWRDPLVGRDVLVGCAAGVTTALLVRITVLAPSWLGDPLGRPVILIGTPFIRTRTFIGAVAVLFFVTMLFALGFLFLLVLLRTLLRSDRLAFGAAVLVGSIFMHSDLSVSGGGTWIGALIVFLMGVLGLVVLTRVGLVAAIVSYLVNNIFLAYPITFDTSAWYSGIGFAALTLVAVLTLYGFRTSLGSRKLFEPSSIES